MILSGLSFIPDTRVLSSAFPLFRDQLVDAIEWAFDMPELMGEPDPTLVAVVNDYSEARALYAHSVRYAVCSAGIAEHHDQWRALLSSELAVRNYEHLTEHFGLMRGGDFHHGAPMPLPLTDELLEVTQENLKLLKSVFNGPVGIENLALAFNLDEVKRQGEFLFNLVQPIDGFILLDLHNIYCQAINFKCSAEEIVRTYPLERVREIHISGGSFADVEVDRSTTTLRCDTHDGPVPEEVFDLLDSVISRTPSLHLVVLEQLPHALQSEEQCQQFQCDFLRMRRIVNGEA